VTPSLQGTFGHLQYVSTSVTSPPLHSGFASFGVFSKHKVPCAISLVFGFFSPFRLLFSVAGAGGCPFLGCPSGVVFCVLQPSFSVWERRVPGSTRC